MVLLTTLDKRWGMGKKGSSPEPVNPGVRSVVEELKELASLRDSGILREEEFQKEKEKISNH